MLKESLIFSVAFLVVLCNSTWVRDCLTGGIVDDSAKMSNCEKPPCYLKARSKVNIEQNIIPNHDISDLMTEAYLWDSTTGEVAVEGVDGTSACEQVYHTDGSKASCPLKSGTQYVYKNTFIIPDKEYSTAKWFVNLVLTEGETIITCSYVSAYISNY